MLKINDNAPDFTLKNTNKEDVSLSDFSDKTVVLAFYPGAYTGVCDSEMCALQDNLKSFNDLNAIVLGNRRNSKLFVPDPDDQLFDDDQILIGILIVIYC